MAILREFGNIKVHEVWVGVIYIYRYPQIHKRSDPVFTLGFRKPPWPPLVEWNLSPKTSRFRKINRRLTAAWPKKMPTGFPPLPNSEKESGKYMKIQKNPRKEVGDLLGNLWIYTPSEGNTPQLQERGHVIFFSSSTCASSRFTAHGWIRSPVWF